MKTEHLTSVYSGLETAWIERNRCVFEYACSAGLALAGSIAMAVACKKAKKTPSDIDFVCCSANDVMAFIAALQSVLMRYESHWRIYVNHNNDFVPPGCLTHFRFQCALWMPICIMVIPAEKFQYWFAPGGLRVQRFEFAKDAASKLEKVDNKDRTSDFDGPRDPEEETPETWIVRMQSPDGVTPNPTYQKEEKGTSK